MNLLPPPWNYVVLATVLALLIGAAEFTVSRRPDYKPISPLRRLLLYTGLLLLVLAFEAFPQIQQFFAWGSLAIAAFLVALICLLFALLYFYVSSANRILLAAQRLASEGRIPAAIALLEEHADRQTRRDPLCGALFHSEIARLHGQQKEWRSADAALDRAFALAPTNPLLFYTKAEILRQRGEVQPARLLVESVLPQFPKSAPLLTIYAELLVEQEQWDAAQGAVEQVASLLDSKECEGIIDRSEWRAIRLQPLRDAITHRRAPILAGHGSGA